MTSLRGPRLCRNMTYSWRLHSYVSIKYFHFIMQLKKKIYKYFVILFFHLSFLHPSLFLWIIFIFAEVYSLEFFFFLSEDLFVVKFLHYETSYLNPKENVDVFYSRQNLVRFRPLLYGLCFQCQSVRTSTWICPACAPASPGPWQWSTL